MDSSLATGWIYTKKSGTNDTKLASDTLMEAYRLRQCPNGVLFHSYRGAQYTSKYFRQLLDRLNFTQSFSAKAHPYDNTVAESFFKYLKHEELKKIFLLLERSQLVFI